MSLALIELTPAASDRDRLEAILDTVERAVAAEGGSILEAHVSAGGDRVYAVAEDVDVERLRRALAEAPLHVPPADVAEVRLIGATTEEVKARRNGAGYLVEWDFPEDLTMDRYLERKRANSVHYAKVPEVRFLRTYVREDMDKCLCLYDAPDEECVRRAREAVNAPVSRLTRIENAP